MNRKLPGLRVALIAYLLIVVTALGGAGAYALWSQSGTVSVDVTAGHWSLPTITLASPGNVVRGNVALTADAIDAETGIRNVVVEYQSSTGTWSTLCTTTAAPYSCQWNTQTVPDGTYGLRAVATANSGLTATSTTTETAVANTFAVTLNDPGQAVRGTVNLSGTLSNPGSAAYKVRVEYLRDGATQWTTLCQDLPATFTCAWDTSKVANDSYDLRAVAVSGPTSTYSETITDVVVDNQAPTVTMGNPGTPLSGTVTFAATASDGHSGIARVQIQYAPTGTSTWKELCKVEEAPYSCRFNTTALARGSYDFRAIATDEAGNTATSATVANKLVDNTVSSVSMEDPGASLTGSATLTATANSTAGVRGVRIQSSPAGTNTWTTRCDRSTAPYSCSWDTRTAADGLYDFRAILTDGTGKDTISASVTGRRVDNIPLRGVDVQAVNGTGTAGRFDAGDTLSFTYNQQVNLGSVTPAWTGAALPVTLRLRDGLLVGTGTSGDTVDIQRSGSAVNLGSVNTMGNFARNNQTVTFNATMTATTVTTAGIPTTVVTVRLGSLASGSPRTVSASASMVWTASSSVTSTSGDVCSTTPVTETGTRDRDF